ncbi:type VII secretion-associated serine protease [Streptomyces sp. S816]|uniref:S8 family serine peptidase n=1 Tax=Streptomyces sp. S816 TaxID=2283197 RepID=UPI001134CF75|nr:S8 family serine peptidase [Streptomyces sp. S816]TGZ12734.1 type VII secretion-associated serine protease [Streptomyces sp. S816]
MLSASTRRLTAACAALGALMALPVGLAPSAAAADVQSQQWYLSAMKADEMWKTSTGKGVKVAVVDSGVNPSTPSLQGQVLADEVPKALAHGATQDISGHGTTMAEEIAGTGRGGGLKGLAPGAKIVPYRVALRGMSLDQENKAPELRKVIRAIADSDVKIINMSFGDDISYDGEQEAFKYAASKGKLMFAAVGNSAKSSNKAGYPVSYPYVVGVSAVDKTATVGKFSNHGYSVDLAAPGVDLPAWCNAKFQSYCSVNGTSDATAIASASAALIWSAHPDWTANQVLSSLIDTASRQWPKDTPSSYLGYGVIRPRKVLENSHFNPGSANVDPLAVEDGVAKPKTSPSASAKSTPGREASAADTSSKSSGNNLTWVVVGAAAALVVIGGAAFAVIRSRRRA